MPIINKGVFDTGDAFYGVDISATDADTTFAYSTIGDKFLLNKTIDVVKGDVRASGNLIANGLIIRNISVSDQVLSGQIISANILADSVTANIWNRLYTSNVVETTNQYFTNVRVLQAVTPVLTTANVVENTNQYFTNTRVLSALVGANVSVNNLIVSGDLEVQGNTVTLNTATLTIEDKNIVLANGAPNSAAADGAGITINGAGATFTYANTGDKFVVNKTLDVVVGDVRASGNLIANGLIIRNISVSDSVLVGSTSANTIVADSVTSNVWNRLYTSNVIENTNQYFTNVRAIQAVTPLLTTANVVETTNQYFTNVKAIQAVTPSLTTANVVENTSLYFSNSRARAAFTAGKGIVIRGDGTIQNTGGAVNYNLDIDGTTSGNILSTMSTMLAFPSVPTTDRFLLRSIHVVNISNAPALVSGNILYATGNTAFFGNQIPVAEGGVLEFMDKPQILQPGDKINLQGFDNSGTATSNILSAMFTYETYSTDPSFIGLGQTLTTNATNYQIYNSEQSSSIVESIKFVNLATTTNAAKLYWADANGILRTHLAYNLPVPPNSSVEILAQPKRINFKDTLYASIRDSTNMSVFVSARLSATYTISENTGNVAPGGTVSTVFVTTDTEGTTLYYTIE
jgi:hypothetical protein